MVDRWRKLGTLTAGLASSELANRVKRRIKGGEGSRRELQLQQAKELAGRLRELKGAAMKVGQQVAMLASQLDLPEEVQQALGTLHAEAEQVPFETIQATLEAEFDAPLTELFAHIDPKPLGTASLAQAHAARLPDGREVVIKVQHEGVQASVDADLMAVRALLFTGRAFGRDRAELDTLFDELSTRLREELDLLQEAVNLQQFGEIYGSDPRVCMPRHHPSLCTERIIVLDRVHGKPIDAFLKTASPEARQRAGLTMAELFLEMAFEHRLLHADPHPGNYLFQDDGTVGLLDFGCVKRFNPFFIGTYAKMVRCAFDGDHEAVLKAAIAIDAWTGEDPEAGQVIIDFCEALVGPLRGDGIYVIGGEQDTVTERVAPILERMWSYPEIRAPRDILFLHRTLGGVYSLLRKLEVGEAWEHVVRPHFERAIAVAQGGR